MRIEDSFTGNYAYKPPTKPPTKPATPVTPAKPNKPQSGGSNKPSDLQLLQAATTPQNVSLLYRPTNQLAAATMPQNVSFASPWSPITGGSYGPVRPPAQPTRPNTPARPSNGSNRPGAMGPFVPPTYQTNGSGLTTVTGGQSITNNPNADGVNHGYIPPYIANGGPGPGDPGYAASVVNYGSPLNNPGFGISIAGGGNPVVAPAAPAYTGSNPNDPNNPANGIDPGYNTNGRGGNVDFNDSDWNPALPYRSGGYDLMEVMNNNAAMYTTGFNYANNFEGAYLGQIEGYDTAGNPLPQIAGYYVHNGRYYPINLRGYNQQNNTPTWQQYTGHSGGSGNGGSGGSGGGSGGGGSSSPVSTVRNDDFFQQALNWKI